MKTALAPLALCALSALPALAQEAPPEARPTTVPGTVLAAPQRVPADLAALIPGNASALIVVAAMDELEEAVQDMVQVLAPDLVMMADADRLLMELAPDGFDIDLIDRARPMALAIGELTQQVQDEPPQVYILIPSTNPGELAAALPFPPELGWTRISGGYLGISPEAVYPAPSGASSLPGRLPEGLIAATLDAEPIVATFGPMVEFLGAMGKSSALAEMQSDPDFPAALKPMAEATIEALFEGAMESMNALRGIDLSIDMKGARFEAGYALTFHEGSPLSSFSDVGGAKLSDLAHLLDPSADMTVAVGMDLGGMVRWARPFVNEILDAIPVPEQAEPGTSFGPFQTPRELMDVARESLGLGMEALTWFGDGIASSTSFEGDRNQTSVWMHGVNADNLSAAMGSLFEAELASLVGLKLETSRLGESTTEMALTLDTAVLAANFGLAPEEAQEVRSGFEQAFGDAIRLSMTSVGGNTLMMVNGDAAAIKQALTAAARRPGTGDAAIQRMVRELGDAHPFAAYRIDLGPLASEFLAVAEAFDTSGEIPPGMSAMLDGVHLPLTIFEGMTTTRWFQGVSVDLSNAGQLAAMAMEQAGR